MKLFANLSIRAKLTAVISLLFWTVSIFIFIFFPARQREQANDALVQRANTLSQNAAYMYSTRKETFDEDQARQFAIEVAKQDSLLIYVVITDNKGNVVESLNKQVAEAVAYQDVEEPFGADPGVCKAKAVLRSSDRKVYGSIHLALSTRVVQAEMDETQSTIALISLIIFLIGVVTVIGVSTVITNPLRNMVETVEQIAGGDYIKRARVSSHDEVGHLAFSFNQMVGNLKNAYDELENANLTLEQRVNERTKELNEEILERKRVEEALRESESRQRAVISALPDLMLLRDGSGIYSPDPVLLIPPGDIKSEMTREQYAWSLMAKFEPYFDAALTTGEVQVQEYSIPFAEMVRYFEARIAPCGIDQTVTIVREITDRREAESQLTLQSAALEAAANSIVILDLDGNVIWVNPAYTELTGFSFSEVFGRDIREIDANGDQGDLLDRMWKTIRDGKVWHGELQMQRKDGTLYYEEQTVTPVRDAAGEITHYISIKSDISERKKIEQSLIAAKESVEAADKLKDAFIANISHGIRTPLYIMIGYLNHISSELKATLTPEQDKYFEFVFESADRLTNSIDLILDISRLQTGNIEFQDSDISLRRVIEDQILEVKSMAEKKNLALTFDNQLGDVRVRADEGFLAKSLHSLLENAVKFTRKGYVEVRLYPRDTGEISIDVEDTGVGISEDYQTKMFQISTPSNDAGGHAFEGVGLGLALVRRYLEQLNGRITIKSARGVGSIFTITLPERLIVSREDTPQLSKFVRKEQITSESIREDNGRRLPTLLVIEDDADTRQFMKITLRKHYNVYTAENVAEAHEIVSNKQVQIIIADVSLGGEESGLDFVSDIRKIPRYSKIPVIAVTAHAFASDRDRCLAAGCNRYFSKPVDHAQLLRTMEELLAGVI
ncbi:MAG: PAS domain S-box protein [Bacteroidetes bacterium]|nr:PAS domain S-box protein [Bacteroidota bacterium]